MSTTEVSPLLPQRPVKDTVESFGYSERHVRSPITHPEIVEAVEVMQRDVSTQVFDRLRNAGQHVLSFDVWREGGTLAAQCRFTPLKQWKKNNVPIESYSWLSHKFPALHRLTEWARKPAPYDGPYDFKDTI